MNPLLITIVGLLGTGFLTWTAWTANTLLKHATVMAALVKETQLLPQIQADVRVVSGQLIDVRLEQERVKAQLAARKV